MITLTLKSKPDDTYLYKDGQLFKEHGLGEAIDVTASVQVACTPGDCVVFDTPNFPEQPARPIYPWGIVQTCVPHMIGKWGTPWTSELMIPADFLQVIDTYFKRGGYAGLTLEEYVTKMYGSR